MTSAARTKAPTTDEIERRFRSLPVRIIRPTIMSTLWAFGFIRGYRWRGLNTDRLLDLEGPVIFVANHSSHADTVAILGSLPRPVRQRTCVAAALDVFGPASSANARTLKALRRECLQIVVAAGWHAFAFDRHGPPLQSLRTASELIGRGWNLLLYPEGTRSRNGRIGRFKPGVAVVAKSTGRPVVPLHVSGSDVVLPCGAFFPGRGTLTVRFGEPMHPDRRESSAAFVTRLEQNVRALAPTSDERSHLAGRRGTSVATVPPRDAPGHSV